MPTIPPSNFHHDPTLYDRLSKPRPEADALAAFAAFEADVVAARERHGITDVVVAVACYVEAATEGGEPMQIRAIGARGSLATSVALGVATFRWARARHVEMLNREAGLGGEGDDGNG